MDKRSIPSGRLWETRPVESGKLDIIIPSTRGSAALPSIKSALCQMGFSNIRVAVTGTSCSQPVFREMSGGLSSDLLLGPASSVSPLSPGKARNQGLALLGEQRSEADYLLFLDDDILLPADYAAHLRRFMEEHTSLAAAMGRVVSRPTSYWSLVGDYSNFWWLQEKRDVLDRGFLGAGATLVRISPAAGLFFDESLWVNEDTDYFQRMARMTGGSLGICASVACAHDRTGWGVADWVRYQFQNGRRSQALFPSAELSPRSILRGIRNALSLTGTSWRAHRKYLSLRPHILLGVAFSFLIYQAGILKGISENSKNSDEAIY